MVDTPAGTSHLLVVGDRRRRGPNMNHEAQVRLVVAHPQCRGGDQRLEPVAAQRILEPFALAGLQSAGVRRHLAAVAVNELDCRGQTLGIGHGQCVDDPRALEQGQVIDHPGKAFDRREHIHDSQLKARTRQRTTQDQSRLAKLGCDVRGDASVGGCSGGQHWCLRVECLQDVGDAPVVRAEVMAPVGYCVSFVDDQQPQPACQLVEHPRAEPRIGQPFRRDQQDVELVGAQRSLHLRPGVDVGGVQRCGSKPCPACCHDLVAHQRQQW